MKFQNKIDKLEKAVIIFKDVLEVMDFEIEKREDIFNDRSEKWQESEKGEEFNEETERLQDVRNDVESEIETIESCIETLRELSE